MEEIKTYFTEIDKENLRGNHVFQGRSKRTMVHGEESDYQSFIETNICITVFKDGALSLTDQAGERSIYFYPEQLKHLEEALSIALGLSMKQDEEL